MDPAEGRPKRRIALIYDGKALKRWQLEAIERLRGDYEIYHLVVEDRNPPKRRFAKHGAYYALNLASLRNRMTRTVPYARGTPADRSVHEFTPAYEGAWAILPRNVHHWLAENRIEAVVILVAFDPDVVLATLVRSAHGLRRALSVAIA